MKEFDEDFVEEIISYMVFLSEMMFQTKVDFYEMKTLVALY